MSDVAEKLAAAGWHRVTNGGHEITEFVTLSESGYFAGTVHECGCLWDEDGEEQTTKDEWNLVPLPKASDPRDAEIERLTACLRKANDGMEEYERKYYLEVNKTEDLTAERDRWRELATRFQSWIKFTTEGEAYIRPQDSGLVRIACREFNLLMHPIPDCPLTHPHSGPHPIPGVPHLYAHSRIETTGPAGGVRMEGLFWERKAGE